MSKNIDDIAVTDDTTYDEEGLDKFSTFHTTISRIPAHQGGRFMNPTKWQVTRQITRQGTWQSIYSELKVTIARLQNMTHTGLLYNFTGTAVYPYVNQTQGHMYTEATVASQIPIGTKSCASKHTLHHRQFTTSSTFRSRQYPKVTRLHSSRMRTAHA